MRVAILGSTGQLGSDLVHFFAHEDLYPLTHDDTDVCDHARVTEVLTGIRPDVVINTTAFHNVDICEDRVEQSFAVNTFAVKNLAQVCKDLGCMLVHFSTDYVFNGEQERPNEEEDLPNPLNVYGVSKLAGEHCIRAITSEHMIIRTSGLFGPKGAKAKGGNFVETMIRLGSERPGVSVVTDQTLSPTFTPDLASKVHEVVCRGHYGLYHITGSGHCSWYGFAERIFDLMKLPARLAKTTTEEFGAKAKRPGFSVLHNGTLSRLGIQPMPHWDESLKEYLSIRSDGSQSLSSSAKGERRKSSPVSLARKGL